MRVSLVVVQFYVADAKLERLVSMFCGILAGRGVEADVIRVDIRPRSEEAEPRYRFLDISGYCEGLSKAGSDSSVVLLNDTFFLKHPWRNYTKSLAAVLRPLSAIDVPCAAGAVFPTQNLVLIDEYNPTRRHVCTFLVAMNPAGRAVFDRLAARLPATDADLGQQWLSSVLSEHRALALIFLLHFSREPNPWAWGGLEYVADERLILRKKVAVTFEYLLSCEILEAGGLLMPINGGTRQWLAEQFERLVRRKLQPWLLS
jgi:hypothetical protein